jgi:hypothetical protein
VIETTWEDVVGFARSIVSLLWIPLAAAVGGIALAAARVTSRIIARRAERRFAPDVMRGAGDGWGFGLMPGRRHAPPAVPLMRPRS